MSETITEEKITVEDTAKENITEENTTKENTASEENTVTTTTSPAEHADTQTTQTTQTVQPQAPQAKINLDSKPETDPFDEAEKERDSSGFLARFSGKIANIHSRREAKLVRDEIILSRIPDKDLMEYLKLEQKRLDSQQHAREIREKRIWIAFQMTITLIAAVLIIYFLKDSPAILISILYTAGLLVAFNIWNKNNRTPKE